MSTYKDVYGILDLLAIGYKDHKKAKSTLIKQNLPDNYTNIDPYDFLYEHIWAEAFRSEK